MRVLHIGKYFPPFAGGIENYCADLIEALPPHDVQCHALVHAHNRSADAGANQIGLADSNVTRCPTLLELAYTPISPGFRRALARLMGDWRPDLLHFHLPNPSAFWALTLASARRIPWIAHWHADVVSSPHDRRLRYLYPFYRPFEQRLLRRCAAIIATSPDYANSSAPLKAHQQRVRIVPLSVDENRLVADPAPSQWPSNGLRVLAIGRLTYYKGFATLLKAISEIADVQLIIIGDGSERTKLVELIQRYQLVDRVELRSGVDDQNRNALMRDCDLFCLPSIERTEAFGLVLLEAMQAGKPVIASNIEGSGVPWVVTQGGNGLLVTPGDSAGLASAISELVDPARRQNLATAAKLVFASQFNIKRNSATVADLYREVLAADSPR